MAANYSAMTTEEFSSILEELVGGMTPGQILACGDVYNILSEELNNKVLALWEQRNPEKAYPHPHQKKSAQQIH